MKQLEKLFRCSGQRVRIPDIYFEETGKPKNAYFAFIYDKKGVITLRPMGEVQDFTKDES